MNEHRLRVEITASDGRALFVAHCSCGWAGKPRPDQPSAADDFRQHVEALPARVTRLHAATPVFELGGALTPRAWHGRGTLPREGLAL
jgi:hypothetical protein